MEQRDGKSVNVDLLITSLLPNLVTIVAILAGLTAIRFGIVGNYERAVQLILLAAVLDGIDGRLARMLKSQSAIGAELDSLADFLNFGVAPALVLYYWALEATMPSRGWLAVLVYVVSCVMRLARFNAASKACEDGAEMNTDFCGIPSPAGALLVMLPMYVSFSISDQPVFSPLLVAGNLVLIGVLLISRIRTPSFKGFRVAPRKTRFIVVGVVITGAAVFVEAWITLIALSLGYLVMVVHHQFRGPKRLKDTQ